MLERIRQTAQTVKNYDRLLRTRDRHGKTLLRTYGERVIRNTLAYPVTEKVIERTEVIKVIPSIEPETRDYAHHSPELDDLLEAHLTPIHISLDRLNERVQSLDSTGKIATLTAEKTVVEGELKNTRRVLGETEDELVRVSSAIDSIDGPIPLQGHSTRGADPKDEDDIYQGRNAGKTTVIYEGEPTPLYGSEVLTQLEDEAGKNTIQTKVDNPQKRHWWQRRRLTDRWRMVKNPVLVRDRDTDTAKIYEHTKVIDKPIAGALAAGLLTGALLGGYLGYEYCNHQTAIANASSSDTTSKFSGEINTLPTPPTIVEPTISRSAVLKPVDGGSITYPVRESTESTDITLNSVPGLQTAIQEATTNLRPETVANAQKMIEEWNNREINVYYFLNRDIEFGNVSDYNAKIDALAYQVYKSRYNKTRTNFQPWDNKEDPQDNQQLDAIKKTERFQEIKLALLTFTGQKTKDFGNNQGNPFTEQRDKDGHLKTFFEHYKDPNCNHSSKECQGSSHLEKYFALIVPKESSGKPGLADGGGYFNVVNPSTNQEVLLPIRTH